MAVDRIYCNLCGRGIERRNGILSEDVFFGQGSRITQVLFV